MSHEIRTPMNGILGFSSLLNEPGLSGKEQQMYIDIIQQNGKRMLDTINDLIDISKIETGQVEISTQEINISEEVENMCRFFAEEANKKGLELELKNLLSDHEKSFKTDQRKFHSILTNLIKNAVKYTDKGSVEIGVERKDNLLSCYVKDTGIGIPQFKQQSIFHRFVQADIADTRAFQGSGLGLSITKAYVDMLGGSIRLESEVGVGTIFHFTLPDNQESNC
jgi:signal transduction histidine kinase